MKKYKNSYIIHNKKKYEIIWISDYAHHVCLNYKDKAHQISHIQIEELLKNSIFIHKRDDVYTGLGKFRNKIYETIVLLKNQRCVIKTSYICHKFNYVKFYHEQSRRKKD